VKRWFSNADRIDMFDFDTKIERKNSGSEKYDRLKKLYADEDVISMWVADMDFSIAPCIDKAIKKRSLHPIYGYPSYPQALYDSIISWIERRHSWSIKKEWLTFSPGVLASLNLAVQSLTKENSTILIQTPVYPPFFNAATDNNRKLLTNPLVLRNGRYEIDFTDLDNKLRESSMLVISNPHNPTGTLFKEDELKEVVSLCDNHDVILFSDEIHSDIVFSKFTPAASVGKHSHIITAQSPSKTFNLAGLSSSFNIISNDDMRKKVRDSLNRLHISTINQYGIVAMQEAYSCAEPWLEELKTYLSKNIKTASDFFRDTPIKMTQPEATYLLWLDCSSLNLTPKELHEFFAKSAKLGLSAGHTFSKDYAQFMRMNVALPHSELVRALNQLEVALKAAT